MGMVMGDFNAKVGSDETVNITVKFGMGNRNRNSPKRPGNRLWMVKIKTALETK